MITTALRKGRGIEHKHDHQRHQPHGAIGLGVFLWPQQGCRVPDGADLTVDDVLLGLHRNALAIECLDLGTRDFLIFSSSLCCPGRSSPWPSGRRARSPLQTRRCAGSPSASCKSELRPLPTASGHRGWRCGCRAPALCRHDSSAPGGDAGVLDETVERILNHAPRTVTGKVYNHAKSSCDARVEPALAG